MTKTISEILFAAADLIEPEGAWTQGLFEGWDGERLEPCSWCLAGAVFAAAGEHWDNRLEPSLPASALGFAGWDSAIDWNDAPERTQAEVVAKLREAAEKAREQGQ